MNLGGVYEAMRSWIYSCPCHSSTSMNVAGLSRFKRQARLFLEMGFSEASEYCFFKGCRLPEVVSGKLEKLMALAFDVSHGILLSLTIGLSELLRSKVFSDFQRGLEKMKQVFQLKLAFFKNIPYLFAGTALPHLEDMHRCFKECVMQHDQAHANPLAIIDDTSKRLFAHDSVIRQQGMQWCQGRDLDDCPDLQICRLEFKFMRLGEWSIEAKHAITTKGLRPAPHHAPPFISMTCLRAPIVLKRLEVDPMFFHTIADLLDANRNPLQMILSVHLAGHPDIVKALCSDRGLTDKKVWQVVYRFAWMDLLKCNVTMDVLKWVILGGYNQVDIA